METVSTQWAAIIVIVTLDTKITCSITVRVSIHCELYADECIGREKKICPVVLENVIIP